MRILIDTNVLIDIVAKREPFFDDSFNAVKKCIYEKQKLMISAHSILDLMYICRKEIKNSKITIGDIRTILKIFKIVGIHPKDIDKAFYSEIQDFEDAVVETIAEREKAKVIITRNPKDYEKSKLKICTPKSFLSASDEI